MFFTETIRRIFGICCPLENLFVANDKLLFQLLKSLAGEKNRVHISRICIPVKGEITRTIVEFVKRILSGNNSRFSQQDI